MPLNYFFACKLTNYQGGGVGGGGGRGGGYWKEEEEEGWGEGGVWFLTWSTST